MYKVFNIRDLAGDKESTCNVGDPSSIPGSERSFGEGIGYPLQYSWASLVAQMVKNPPGMWEIPGLGRFPGGGHGNPLQCSCLENAHGQRSLAGSSLWGCKSRTRLSDWAQAHICTSRYMYISNEIVPCQFFIKGMILFKRSNPINLLKIECLECRGVTGNAWCGPAAETLQQQWPVLFRLWAGCESRYGLPRSAPLVPCARLQGFLLNLAVSLEMSVLNDCFRERNDFFFFLNET